MVVPSDIPELLKPGKRIFLPGKILLKPYGTMVWKKEKRAIVTTEKFAKYVDIPIYLIEDDVALAIIRIKPAKEIDEKGFKKLSKFHMISEKERKLWWPYEKSFYYYSIEIISKFDPPKKIIKPDGSYSWLDSVVFKGVDIGDPSEFKNADLMRGHDLIHGFWNSLNAPSDECIKYHILFRREILKRKLSHKVLDSLDHRAKEIEEKLAKAGYEISFDREKSMTKIEKSDEISKPYLSAHSCRLNSPSKYKKYARKNCAAKVDGKCVDFIFGINDGKSELQSMRYKKSIWELSSAKNHCKSKSGMFEAASEKPKKLAEEIIPYSFNVDSSEIDKDNKKELSLRWNLSLSEYFDIEAVESVAANFEFDMASKFLSCDVKGIYQNNYLIPSPMTGTYLSGFKKILSEFEFCDCRNFSYNGREIPPMYETIELNSEKSDDFLIDGTSFYRVDGKNKFIIKFQPSMYGIEVQLFSTNDDKAWNKDLLKRVHSWSEENNFLKGEIFELNGGFLKKTTDTYDDIILDEEILNCVKKAVNQLNDKKENALSRGLMFVGKPGTGKTKTGKVLMNTLKDTTFIWISSRDFHKVGSNTALRLGFDLARKLSPSLLFMEDIDTWLKGGSIDLLKTEMDGLKENKGMITILTSNTPKEFPDALLDRPGRFHDVLEFSLPSKDIRKKMIEKWVKEEIEKDLMESILKETEGYSGAHIKELVDFAKMIKSDDGLDTGDSLLKSLEKLKRQKDLISRIKDSDSEKIDDLKEKK